MHWHMPTSYLLCAFSPQGSLQSDVLQDPDITVQSNSNVMHPVTLEDTWTLRHDIPTSSQRGAELTQNALILKPQLGTPIFLAKAFQ